MVRIADFTNVPGALIISAMIAEQYSEGCFATWEPQLDALVATVTGSARPVHKGSLEEKDLAVIVGVRPDGMGAYYRPVEGLPNDPPSSEAVELYGMDEKLPRISWHGHEVPVTRSKLHGHRGVAAYDPKRVEFVPLEEVYHHYPVTCASEAQALAVKAAFQRAACLRDPEDPRTLAFTIIPCHGVITAPDRMDGCTTPKTRPSGPGVGRLRLPRRWAARCREERNEKRRPHGRLFGFPDTEGPQDNSQRSHHP